MKHLYYEKKFYKEIDDKTGQDINMSLVGSPRPFHIVVDGEALKASMLEVRDPEAGVVRVESKVSYDDIKQFERKYDQWKALQVPEERGWEFFGASHGLIRLTGVYTAPSGLKRCLNFSVIDPVRFTKFSKQYAAMQAHFSKVDYAKKKELQEQEAKLFPG